MVDDTPGNSGLHLNVILWQPQTVLREYCGTRPSADAALPLVPNTWADPSGVARRDCCCLILFQESKIRPQLHRTACATVIIQSCLSADFWLRRGNISQRERNVHLQTISLYSTSLNIHWNISWKSRMNWRIKLGRAKVQNGQLKQSTCELHCALATLSVRQWNTSQGQRAQKQIVTPTHCSTVSETWRGRWLLGDVLERENPEVDLGWGASFSAFLKDPRWCPGSWSSLWLARAKGRKPAAVLGSNRLELKCLSTLSVKIA